MPGGLCFFRGRGRCFVFLISFIPMPLPSQKRLFIPTGHQHSAETTCSENFLHHSYFLDDDDLRFGAVFFVFLEVPTRFLTSLKLLALNIFACLFTPDVNKPP